MPQDKAWDNCDVDAVADKIHAGQLTPRTREACEAAGVVPEEMLPISKEEFKERQGVDLPPKHIMKMRWEHFEKLRKSKIKDMLEARKQILEEDDELGEGSHQAVSQRDHNRSVMTQSTARHHSKSVMGLDPAERSTLIQREKQEIEKIKQKQQKELEQMMEYELKL
jgi:hypothetical protein